MADEANEETKAVGPKPGQPKRANAADAPAGDSQSVASQAAVDAVAAEAKAAADKADLERLCLENENLKLQAANLATQLKIAEKLNPKPAHEIAAEKEATITAKIASAQDKAKEVLEAGPKKFHVRLPEQIPAGTQREGASHSPLLVGATSPAEAIQKYNVHLGIRVTTLQHLVDEVATAA